eukprot:scaffold64674_cov33-Prasinocladus_malaysianus.AAC.1
MPLRQNGTSFNVDTFFISHIYMLLNAPHENISAFFGTCPASRGHNTLFSVSATVMSRKVTLALALASELNGQSRQMDYWADCLPRLTPCSDACTTGSDLNRPQLDLN